MFRPEEQAVDELLTRVTPQLHTRFREIVALTDKFCEAHLDAEYRDICRELTVEVCQAGVPVESGKAAGWAAGVISTVGFVNFFSDSAQPFHMSPGDMAKRAGVSVATLQSKSKAIRDALDIGRMDLRFSTSKINADNPFIWILVVNGLPMDIRSAPREAQEVAFKQGLIPYIPADGPPATSIRGRRPAEPEPAPRRAGKKKGKAKTPAGPVKVYALNVSLLEGPITKAFAKKNRQVIRTIEIRGDQTLEELHEAIFDAFDRDDPHMYEFQFGTRPMDPDGTRYVLPMAVDEDDGFGPKVAGTVTEATIEELGLKVDQHFGYWFDFGDDWWHQIDVVAISDGPPKGKYPRVTKRVGESPPQYIDGDEEE